MLQKSKIFQAVIILLISFNFSCAQRGEFDPPKGYWSQLTMKLAYATGRLKLIDPSPEIPNNLVAYKDVVYKETKEKTLKLDLYHKNTITKPTPLLVFIHGGSWKSGDKDDYRRYLVDYAEKGYITATIAYRFSQEAPFPAAFDDVVCAIKWLKDHASEYHVDTENIAVIGGSAGGHLAMLLAYHGNDDSYTPECESKANAKIKAIVNLYGPADLTTEIAKKHPTVSKFIGKEYSDATLSAFVAASPIKFITPDDPPTLVFHGTIDDIVKVEQSDKLEKALKQKNVSVSYHRLKGWPHTMDLGLKVNKYCQHYMDEFFEKYLIQ